MECKRINVFPDYGATPDGEIVNLNTGCVLKGKIGNAGYREVTLVYGENHFTRSVHRLIADAFCQKNNDSDEVNHINGNKLDNRAENLEWVTHGDNLLHAFTTGLMPNNAVPRPVIATSMDTGEQMQFPSIYKAARFLGISQGNICLTCQGKRPYAGGYLWRYAE